jgi:transcriptional regulator GlxA family with amidase domain
VITSGGFLSVVDLCLYLIAKTVSQKIAHDMGRMLLADTVRQKQSVYAQSLVSRRVENAVFEEMENWIDQRLHLTFTLEDMAHHCKMSLRTFQRLFAQTYGTSPNKFLQLRRIEKAKHLLQTSTLSTQEVIETIGLSDIASFRKLFQRELGMSPAAFRKRMAG